MAFDAEQQRAIEATGGHYLVLAAPGCGKTTILTQRILHARQQGIPFSEMLCLTFTNRASREMKDRIHAALGEDCNELFVGNIHRFCSSLLFENNLLPANVAIIDEEEQGDILTYFDDHYFLTTDGSVNRSKVSEICELESYITQRRLHHPMELLKGSDEERRGDIYVTDYNECYQYAAANKFDVTKIEDNDTWRRLRFALLYHQYKEEHLMVDFADLLLLGYEALLHGQCRRYRWIQVDEVQDLNHLQHAIIDALTAKEDATVMYLGDEQQAIYTFLGAKPECLRHLRERCKGHIFTLTHNYRSPNDLLHVFNTYAEQVLQFPNELLPTSSNERMPQRRNLILAQSPSAEEEMERAIRMVQYYGQFPNETVALLVRSNREADRVSLLLERAGISHFKISGGDLFRSTSFKTFIALFSVLINEFNAQAWSHLLYGVGALPRLTDARETVERMRRLMLTPFDLFAPQSGIEALCHLFCEGEMVFFDTETTGLDVFEDDIVQIAAFKVRCGQKVEDSDFNIIMETQRPIPERVGDGVNPLVEEYHQRPHLSREEGLRLFLNYVGHLPLLGHNARYDYAILQHNVRRHLHCEVELEVFDSLRLIKCVRPDLKEYKLKTLLSELHLEGENSHLADADIAATLSLVRYCVDEAMPRLRDAAKFLALPATTRLRSRLQKVESLLTSLQSILDLPLTELKHDLSDLMEGTYKAMLAQGFVADMGAKFDIFLRYMRTSWLPREEMHTMRELIGRHLLEATTSLSEGDLINSIERECRPIFVMTVHKGKGLEFDNVIVLNAAEGTYPSARSMRTLRSQTASVTERNDARNDIQESARCFYVAITRARKRLCISYSILNFRGIDTRLTPFMEPIQQFFLQ